MSVATIDRTTILQKTTRGRAEIGRRRARLSAVQRQVLIVIDGQRDAAAIGAMFPRADVLEAFGVLAEEGLIETAAPAVRTVDPAFGAFRKAIEAPLPVAAEPLANGQRAENPALAAARQFMADAARTNIGLLAERLIARIDRTDTLDELAAVASQWHMALRESKRGKPLADDLLEHALGLLGAPTLLHLS